jgi:hypothetical protein
MPFSLVCYQEKFEPRASIFVPVCPSTLDVFPYYRALTPSHSHAHFGTGMKIINNEIDMAGQKNVVPLPLLILLLHPDYQISNSLFVCQFFMLA